MTNKNGWLIFLPFAGTLPFIFAASLSLLGVQHLPVIGSTTLWLKSYTLIIACFMSGIYWGQATLTSIAYRSYLLILSNILALSQWFAYMLLTTSYFLVQSILFFLILFCIDYTLYHKHMLDKTYLLLRGAVTLIVIISILICALSLLPTSVYAHMR